MKVIITGGTGLIGRALAHSLAADHHDVIILSRTPEKAGKLPAGVRAEKWDGRTAAGWGHLADGADAIVNLAGANIAAQRWMPARKEIILNSRVHAGQAVVEAINAAAVKPGVVVQASAVGYYGPRDATPVTEDAPAGSDFLAQVCVAWENSTAAVETVGVRRVIIRTGVVLDAAAGALPKMALPFKLFAGGPVGSGQQGFPWVHRADEIAAIRFLIEHPEAHGPFNLTAPNPPNNAQFSRALGRALHRPALMPAPGFALRLAFGEMAAVLLEGQRAAPHRLQALDFQFQFSQAETALHDLFS
jgi:hypothetical protein